MRIMQIFANNANIREYSRITRIFAADANNANSANNENSANIRDANMRIMNFKLFANNIREASRIANNANTSLTVRSCIESGLT